MAPAAAGSHQANNDFPVHPAPDAASSHYHDVPRQPYNHALHWQNLNAWAPPALANDQLPEGHREGIPPPIRGIAGPGRAQDLHDVDVVYQDVAFTNLGFPDAGHVQGVPIQGQPSAPVNLNPDPNIFAYFPQHIAPGPPQAAFPHPLHIQQVPTPDQLRAENLRRLARRYLDHPDTEVRMVCTEEGTADGYKSVMIMLETPNVP